MHLELRGITKSFGSLRANDSIDLTVEAGEIHCLLGENGAGKSTLMNIIFGMLRADAGEICVDGQALDLASPREAMAAGIGMVHQHFMLVPVFTVAENLMLGNEETGRLGWLDVDAARARVREISARFGFDLDPDASVGDLPVGVQQRVEIVKALSRDAKILIFDEPTAVLTPDETDDLMDIMRRLRDSGCAIVFITHKLREVREVADRITVLRSGRVAGEAAPTATNPELASLMVGRPVGLRVDKRPADPGRTVLEIRDLTVVSPVGHLLVDDLDLEVRRGEVLAVAGVQGNGQTELTEAILGLQVGWTDGDVRLDGERLLGRTTRQVMDAGVGFVPEDRRRHGLVGDFSVAENLVLNRSTTAPFSVGGAMVGTVIEEFAARAIRDFDIRVESAATPVRQLSGGNQQKVVLARELERELKLLVVAQPTRGLDVGSIEFVHSRIMAARDSGVAVLLVSSELDEVEALADRIAVMYRGKVVGVVPGDTPREVLGVMMTGELPMSDRGAA